MENKTNQTAMKAALLLASSLPVMAGATIAPSLPQMSEVFSEVPNAEFLAKLILTIPALFIALVAPLSGFLVDKFGRLRIMMGSMVLYALAGTTGLYLNDIYAILVGRIFLGVAVAGVMTTVSTLVGDYFDQEERNKFLGTQGAAMALGGMVFVGAGGLLADIGWRYPFAIYFFSLVLIPVSIAFLIEPDREKIKAESERAGGVKAPIPPTIWLLYGTAIVMMILFYLIPVQLPFFLKTIGIEENSSAGLAIATVTLFSATASVLYRFVKPYLSYQWVFGLGFIIMSGGYFILYFADSYGLVLAGMVVGGMGAGWMMPNINLWLLSLAPAARRGRIVGGLTMSFFIGQFFSPIIAETLKGVASLNGIFGLGGVGLVLAGLGYTVYAIIARTPAEEPAPAVAGEHSSID